jgi:Fe2+ transport system protein FeoA
MNNGTIKSLNQLKPGEKARVMTIAGGRSIQNRLVGMGLNVGSLVELLRAPTGSGGPALVATGGTRLAVGAGMASKIIVAMDPG